VIATSGIVACSVTFAFLYASAEIPISKRVLGTLVMSGWSSLPYVVIISAAVAFARRIIASYVMLFGTLLIVASHAYLGLMIAIHPDDGQNSFAIIVLPFGQLAAVFLMVVVSAVTLVIEKRN
jgi:hypothetical protein